MFRLEAGEVKRPSLPTAFIQAATAPSFSALDEDRALPARILTALPSPPVCKHQTQRRIKPGKGKEKVRCFPWTPW